MLNEWPNYLRRGIVLRLWEPILICLLYLLDRDRQRRQAQLNDPNRTASLRLLFHEIESPHPL